MKKHIIKGVNFADGMSRVRIVEEYLSKIGHEIIDAKFHFDDYKSGCTYFQVVLYSKSGKITNSSVQSKKSDSLIWGSYTPEKSQLPPPTNKLTDRVLHREK